VSGADRARLIVYAVPLGPLGDGLREYWRRAAAVGPNAAMGYPPHCTVTGFFTRERATVDAVVGALDAAVRSAAPGPASPRVERLVLEGPWIGLVLDASDLVRMAERLASTAPTGPDDDPVRPKDDPHLSLAYEFDPRDTSTFAALATRLVPTEVAVPWELRLYEGDRGGTWRVVEDWALAPPG
jgi:ubiquitin-associated SH3 domain-containing protein